MFQMRESGGRRKCGNVSSVTGFHILEHMDQNQAIEKARQFARTRYTGEIENIVGVHERKVAEMREKMSSRGILHSGTMIIENARIDGEQIRAMTEARLDSILEGNELYGIAIDDQLAINICDDVIQGMNQLVNNCKCPSFGNVPSGLEPQYPRMVAQAVGLSANLVKTEIDRRRLMTKKESSPTTNYYVQGENARVNVNSTDNSLNVVMGSKEEFFSTLQQRIESGVPEGDEKRKVLDALTALGESHGKPSFAQRYTDFIAAAANHITVIVPFVPALTEMLHKVLK